MINLNAATVDLYPFPHFVIKDALPRELYGELSETFPEEEILRCPHGENQRIDIHARDRDRLPANWREFVEEHISAEWWESVRAKFWDVMRFYYPLLEAQYGAEWRVGIRGEQKATMHLDCQPGVNTPQTGPGRVRGPHLDNPVELFGGMLYMGSGPGHLNIYRYLKEPRFHGKLEIVDECVEIVHTVDYEPNVLVMFLNTPASVHGVTARPATDKCRRMVNFIGELPAPLFRVGHGRY